MKTRPFLNRWIKRINALHNVFNNMTGPRSLFKRPVHLIILLLVTLSASGQPSGTVVLAAVGQNALTLTGVRPNGFDQSGYVEVPYSVALNSSLSSITIEAWVKRNETNRIETLVGNGWQTSYWLGFSDQGKLRFGPHGSDSLVNSESTVSAGVWTHVAVTYDGTTRNYYINGILDKTTTAKSGAIVPASSGQWLGIGFDRDDNFTPNYFGGLIDNLRIWRTVRSVTSIKSSMFQSFGSSFLYLLAEWDFNGDAYDPVGSHDGTLRGTANFTNEGAIPHDIRIPQVSETPDLDVDGYCRTLTEYAFATQVTVDGTSVYLMHTADDLWVCFDDLRASVVSAYVYLDPDYTRIDPAQSEHLVLEVKSDDTLKAREGAGDNTYTDTTAADGLWDGDYAVCCGEYPSYRAEFRISNDLLGGWSHVIGLALGKSTGLRGGFDLWPAFATSYQPSTWSNAILGGISDPRTFSGQVVYQPRTSSADPVGVGGVKVNLISSDANGSEALVDTVNTNLNGNFSLTTNDDYTRHRLEMGAPPKGYLAKKAEAGAPGVVVDARTLDYGTAAPGTYSGNIFTLGDALPYVVDSLNGPNFQIVAPQHIIDSGALDEFVDFKRRIGFTVAVTSVETVDASFSGANRREKIRALEQARFETQGGSFHQYLMLIGSDDVIPFARFTFGFTGYVGDESPVVDLDGCLEPEDNAIGVNYSEWYYADLVSDFDSNGNGCLLDGIFVDSNKTPFASGYSPDATPIFQATVAVGRIPLDTESGVRTALTNSMRFEQQSQGFKLRTLLAMSYYWMEGQYWSPKDDMNGSFKPCPPPNNSAKKKGVSKICTAATEDAAVFAEEMKTNFLNPKGYSSTILYESAKVPDASPVVSPKPLTAQNLLDELNATYYGLVNIGGHGGSDGVGRSYWSEVNGNATLDSPTEPFPFLSVNEVSGATLIDNAGLDTLTPDNSHGSIYIPAACSTGYPLKYSFGAKVLEQGHGVGWVGALNGISIIAPVDYDVTAALLSENLRLGDAAWFTFARQAVTGSGTARWSMGLYGDPTLSYWGNPGGQSTLAAWPMLRYDARGQGYTPLAGPELPKKQWEYSATAPGTTTLLPSPVVSNNGEVIVAHGSYVDVLRQGVLYQRLALDGPAFGTPAIAADGTIYAMDVSGYLYAFQFNSLQFFPIPFPIISSETRLTEATSWLERTRRWKLDLNNVNQVSQTSPIIGADGYIAYNWGYSSNTGYSAISLIRPDGTLAEYYNIPGHAIGSLAVGADRKVYVATTTGYLAAIDFFCPSWLCVVSQTSSTAYSTPPLLAYGYVYVGKTDGEVVKVTTSGLSEQATFQADSEITAGPVAGPAGQVLVGTKNGTLYSLTKDLTLRWQRSTGSEVKSVPAFSADAVYIASNDKLQAYNPFSGAPVWTYNLGSGAGGGSAVVGYGREVYVQTTSGKVIAVGEGWSNAVIALAADSVISSRGTMGIKVEWWVTPPPDQANEAALSPIEAQSTTVGILLQRSADDGDWEDVAVLPPGTTVYTDTGVLDNTSYAYRAQVLDSTGNDSDFTTTLVDVQSLPSLPNAPTLSSITVEAADALGLEWSSPAGDVVSEYHLERSLNAAGPFSTTIQTGGGITSTLDIGLAAETTYYYRVVAVNDAGESDPSTVQSGTTRQQSLSAPENANATLQDDDQVQISWTGGPEGASTVIEYNEGISSDYLSLATSDTDGPYGYYPGLSNTYIYRLKFVLGNAESPYAETGLVTIVEVHRIYLPLTLR